MSLFVVFFFLRRGFHIIFKLSLHSHKRTTKTKSNDHGESETGGSECSPLMLLLLKYFYELVVTATSLAIIHFNLHPFY